MKSKLIAASVLAVAALGSASSFAEGNFAGRDPVSAASSRTRADVKAEFLQAQRDGYSVVRDQKDWLGAITPVTTQTSRSIVRAEVLASHNDAASPLYSGQ